MKYKRSMILDTNKIWMYAKELLNNKKYMIPVCLTAFFSFGYEIFHGSIGADDMTLKLYFVDGLAPQIGRNTLYLINKVLRISDFSPVITDFLGVFLMIIAATILGAAFQEIFFEGGETWLCTIFTSTMISFSLTSEVYIYYLHNGIGIGYFLTTVALIIIWGNKGDYVIRLLLSSACLTFAITCYESFALVFLLGFFLLHWFMIMKKDKSIGIGQYIKDFVINMIPVMILALVGRQTITLLINKHPLENYSPRGLGAGKWIFQKDALDNIREIVQGVIRDYGINSIVICSLMILNVVLLFFLIDLLVRCIGLKNWMGLLNGLGMLCVPWLFLIIEGHTTAYRQMQALNILEGFALMVLCYRVSQIGNIGKVGKWFAIICSLVVIYNQSFEQNYFYYIDYLRYTDDVAKMDHIMLEICRNYDIQKPLCFIADEGEVSSGIIKEYYYYDKNSSEYIAMSKWASKLGITLETNESGYCPFQTLALDVPVWAASAWDGNYAEEEFLKMHGYNIVLGTKDMLDEANEIGKQMQSWPMEGSIKDMKSYIVIKL